MKKRLRYLTLLLCLILAGCSKKDQMIDYIPTTVSKGETGDTAASGDTAEQGDKSEAGDTDEASDTEASDEAAQDGDSTDSKPIHVGQTTTMYVKLGEYNAVLNVRATPSKDGEIVGFLVHTERVNVIEIVDGWASFKYNGAICYVSADFLVDERPAYIDPPTITPKPTNTPNPTATSAPENDQELPPEI